MPSNFTLIGNLVREPELRRVGANGTAVCHFTVAGNNREKDRVTGEWVNKPVFCDFDAWGLDAEFVNKWFKKGSPIAVMSSAVHQEEWVGKDGQKRSKLKFVVRPKGVDFVGGKKAKEETEDDEDRHAIAAMDAMGGEIPF